MFALVVGAALGASTAVVNNVPIFLGEVAYARADRSGWAQAAEFVSLILDSGWAWAATAITVGWQVSKVRRPEPGTFTAALGGAFTLVAATTVYDLLEASFQGFAAGWDQVRVYWLWGSLLLGPALGVVGALIRHPGMAGVLAALVVPVGATINMIMLPPPPESPVARAVVWTVWGAAIVVAGTVVTRALLMKRLKKPAYKGEPG